MEPGTYEHIQGQSAWDDYKLWEARKAVLYRTGSRLVIFGAILLLLEWEFAKRIIELSVPPANSAGPLPVTETLTDSMGPAWVAIRIWRFVCVCLLTLGGARVAKSKGLSVVFGLLGVFAYLLPDRNKREAPQKPSTGVKPPGSEFSDW